MALSNGFLFEQFAKASAWSLSLGKALVALKRSPGTANPGVALCCVRDEIDQLPHFLDHYRRIGVNRFVFIDNGSKDGTTDFLLEQADCDVFQSAGNFRESGEGTLWKNFLMAEYRSAPWFLSMDVDEHVVYDGWPELKIDDFVAEMSRLGHSVATAIMVDMYGPGPIAATVVAPGGTLLDTCPLFDGEGYTIAMPGDWRADHFPRLDVRGGPEARCFGGGSWMIKAPLVMEPNVPYRDPHGVYPAGLNFAAPRMALLHFRFLAPLAAKVARLREREQREGKRQASAAVYRQVGEKLASEPDFSMAYPGSVRFESPRQFVERGMIRPLGPATLP